VSSAVIERQERRAENVFSTPERLAVIRLGTRPSRLVEGMIPATLFGEEKRRPGGPACSASVGARAPIPAAYRRLGKVSEMYVRCVNGTGAAGVVSEAVLARPPVARERA